MIIASRNFLTTEPWVPVTRTTNLEVAGTNNIRWENPNGFQANWAIQIGDLGEEQTEICLLNSSTPNGTAGTLTANTLYEHPSDTPIYGIKYDQVVFERSTTGTLGTATILTNGTVNISPDQQNTIFDDTTGTSTYTYKTFFRNSVLAVNTTESDWIIPGGYQFYALGRMRERAKERIFNSKFIKSDLTWNDWANEWLYELTNAAISVNEAYMIGTEDVGFGTDGLGTVTTTNFKQTKRVDITYDGGLNLYLSTKANLEDFQIGQAFIASHPYHVWRGNNVFQVNPAENGGTARLAFYAFGTNLVNDSDELPHPMRPYTKSFVDYMQAQAYRKDGKQTEFQTAMAEALAGKNQFLIDITPRDKTGPTMVRMVEALSGEDSYFSR